MKRIIFNSFGKILTKSDTSFNHLEREVENLLVSSKLDEICFVVPTNRKARNLRKEIISNCPQRSVNHINVETLTTLFSTILTGKEQFTELSEAASSVFIEKCSSTIKLKYFTNFDSGFPFGTLERIKNVISEYKKNGINPNLLRTEAQKLSGSEKLKALDIADIYESYLAKCSSLNALEIGDVYSRLLSLPNVLFEDLFREKYKNVKIMCLDGFSEFTNSEIEIINKLSSIEGLQVFINFLVGDGNNLLFAHQERLIEKFKDKDFREVQINQEQDKLIKYLSKNLFRVKSLKKINDFDNQIFRYSGRTKNEEIKLIAKEIKKLIIDEKVEPHNICVVFNLVKDYSSICKDVFETYEIPYNLTDRTRLDQANPITTIISFIEILENKYFFKNIIRAMSSGLINFPVSAGQNLIKCVSALRIISGKENWLASIDSELNKLEEEQTALKNVFQESRNIILKIDELLNPFENDLTPIEFYNNLKKLIMELEIHKNLAKNLSGKSESNIKALSTFMITVHELINLIIQEEGVGRKFKLKYYMDQLRTASNWARYNIKERSDKGVLITSLDEIRGFKFDYLFLCGMNEGEFPTRYEPEIFFSGSFRMKENEHQTIERYKFFNALLSWNKKLYLSYSSTDGKKDLVKSSFIDEIDKLFSPQTEVNSTISEIYSPEELLIASSNNSNLILDEKHAVLNIADFKRKADIENSRGNENDNPSFNGIINLEGNDIDIDSINKLEGLREKEFSVSQLELYAKCPHKYFLNRIVNINDIKEPEDEPEALEIGLLLHDILFEFYSKIRDEGRIISHCSEGEFIELGGILKSIAEKKYSEMNFTSSFSFYIKEKIFGVDDNWIDSILFKFLSNERENDKEMIPSYFEVPFGSVNKNNSEKLLFLDDPVDINGVKIRGRIDRVDVDKNEKSFEVIDYKSGRINSKISDILNGLQLQIPIYMLVVKHLLEEKFGEEYFPKNSYLYSLKFSKKDFGKRSLLNAKMTDEDKINLLDESAKKVKEYFTNILNGEFNLTQDPQREKIVCGYCEYKWICRKKD